MPRRAVSQLVRLLRRFRREPVLPAVVLIVAGALWGFMELADEVQEGDSHALDRRILLAMRVEGDTEEPVGPEWLEEAGRDFTALGGGAVLTLITLAAIGAALILKRRRIALMIVIAIAGGTVLSTLLKRGFDRPRPDLISHGAEVVSKSFPSGHSMMSAIVYLTLGTLLTRVLPSRRLKIYVLSLAVALTVLVGLSRVYLGVHWPTDVVAGWSVGAAWALLFWLISVGYSAVSRGRQGASEK